MSKVLVIDDNMELLEMLEFILRTHNYTVQIAQTKSEAVSQLNKFKPDIILLDVRLQSENGRKLCRFIKSTAPWDPLIFLMSASPELLKHYQDCLADDIIAKPFVIHTILSKTDQFMTYRKNSSVM